MGFTRFLYDILGLEYIGSAEQLVIDKQKHQKYLVCEQIKKSSNLRLKKVEDNKINSLLFYKVLQKQKEKQKNKRKKR